MTEDDYDALSQKHLASIKPAMYEAIAAIKEALAPKQV